MQENNNFINHSIIIDNRKQINLTGISDCIGFDEETILLDTKLGKLTIKGSGLHIISFNTDNGDLIAEGQIHAIGYTQNDKKGGLITKLFR